MPTIDFPQRVSCSERLPDIGEYVLVQTFNGDMYIMCLAISEGENFSDTFFYWKTYEESIEWGVREIIAWMPLPEPYKEEPRMTLDEAIKHAEEVASRCTANQFCAEEHRQFAEWLSHRKVRIKND